MECEQADRNRSKIRQGDVIAAHPGTPNWEAPFQRFHVVVSADCDIVNDKLETGLVVVPVIGLRSYAERVWAPSQLSKVKSTLLKASTDSLLKLGMSSIGAEAGLQSNDTALLARLGELETDTDPVLKKAAKRMLTLRAAAVDFEGINLDDPAPGGFARAVEGLAKVKSKLSGTSCTAEAELFTGVSALSDSKKVDVWPICDLIGLDGEMREDERDGFVAMFRYFTRIPFKQVHLERKTWLNDPDGYIRVCRLRGIYKSDFLQRFANLFIRVGLEGNRDDEHRLMYERASKKFSRVPE